MMEPVVPVSLPWYDVIRKMSKVDELKIALDVSLLEREVSKEKLEELFVSIWQSDSTLGSLEFK